MARGGKGGKQDGVCGGGDGGNKMATVGMEVGETRWWPGGEGGRGDKMVVVGVMVGETRWRLWPQIYGGKKTVTSRNPIGKQDGRETER